MRLSSPTIAVLVALGAAPLAAQATGTPPKPATPPAAAAAPLPATMTRPVFRVVHIANDSIVLGAPWPGAARHRATTEDTTVRLPEGSFSGADAISVQLDRAGIVRRIDFTYRAPRDVEALVRGYHEQLGLPTTADAETSAGTPRMQWLWRDDRTEFMFAELRPALEDVRAIALLIDREGERRAKAR